MTSYPPLIPKSSIQGVAWPAMPGAEGALMLAMQYQLANSQWWEPEYLLEQQLKQLVQLLRHAEKMVPYYEKRWGTLGIRAASIRSFEDFRQLPILKRTDIQTAGNQLHARQLPGGHGQVFEHHTSGSTGRPITTLGTELTQFFWNAFTLRDHLWRRRDLGAKLAAIRYCPDSSANPPLGKDLPGWGPSTDLAFNTGPSSVLSIDSTVTQQAEWLLSKKPDYLLTHPTVAHALARHFIEHRLSLPGLREVRTLSETLPGDLRVLCQQAWGVPVVDMYSAREVGYVALQCPGHEHYHVQSESLLVEILDAGGAPCAPGQIGRVILTSLHNFAFPLIRYEIGDYAEVGPPCPCQRGLPVINRVMGRVRNMLKLPTGEQRWPILNYKAYSQIIPLRQLKMIQHSLKEIEVYVVASRAVTPQEELDLTKSIQQSLGYPFELNFFYCDDISRSKSGKFEDFMCEIPAAETLKS